MAHDIFISYSRRDLAAVKPIKEELESLGFSCWMDLEGIESGSQEFTEEIASAIRDTPTILFFLSTASQTSRWSLNELRLARARGKHLVLVRFNDDSMHDTFMLEFGGTDIIDWRIQEQKEKLLRDLGKWASRQSAVEDEKHLSDSERQLARIISMFPKDGVENYVLRRLWLDYLGKRETDERGRDSFQAIVSSLCRNGVVFRDFTDGTIRMDSRTRDTFQKDMGQDKESEADKVSDFLAAWLGFTPFDIDRLRHFAKTSLLGRRLFEEADALEKWNDARMDDMVRLLKQDPESARIHLETYCPIDEASPLEWAQFLEGGESTFSDPSECTRLGIILERTFKRRHWVYAYMNRGYARLLDGPRRYGTLLDPRSHDWNFFDYLTVLSREVFSDEIPFPKTVFTSDEWLVANQFGSTGVALRRLGAEFRRDSTYLDGWTARDFEKLSGSDWRDFLVGLNDPNVLEHRTVPVGWYEFGVDDWLVLLGRNAQWEFAFSRYYGWSRLVDELCKAERQAELIRLLKSRLEEYGAKFDWANLPVPTSEPGEDAWSAAWAEALDSHPEMSDKISPKYLGKPFWMVYAAWNPELIKDLEVRHPEWKRVL